MSFHVLLFSMFILFESGSAARRCRHFRNSGLDQADAREGAERQRGKRRADIERPQIDGESTCPVDELADFIFRARVVAGIKEDALAARRRRLRQQVDGKMVERLHDARTRNELADYSRGNLAAEVDVLEAV